MKGPLQPTRSIFVLPVEHYDLDETGLVVDLYLPLLGLDPVRETGDGCLSPLVDVGCLLHGGDIACADQVDPAGQGLVATERGVGL